MNPHVQKGDQKAKNITFNTKKIQNPCDQDHTQDIKNGTKWGGGARRDRTADLYNAIVALSQLSYDPHSFAL